MFLLGPEINKLENNLTIKFLQNVIEDLKS